jgi:hypothetical protein
MSDSILTSKTAKRLSKLGASKGGTARANILTPDERSDIARRAVAARWAKAGKTVTFQVKDDPEILPERKTTEDGLPFSMLRGALKIGDVAMECHVLSDGRRVLTQREVVRVLTAGRDSGNLQAYLQSKVFADNPLDLGAMIQFKIPGTQYIANGYEATLLIELCERYLEARNLGILKGKQKALATQAEIIMRASAKIGIIALIDEATGYQRIREKQALQLKLQAFIAEDLQDWALMFPTEFWLELARLEGVHYSPRSRPLRWGKYIMAFVYDAVDQDVGNTLRELNPDPHYRQNHHQWLEQFGRQKVNDHLQRVIAIMKLCKDMKEFRHKFDKVFSRSPFQETFAFMESDS